MYNYENAIETSFVKIYFIVVLAIGNFILLSLFTIILLENFNEQESQEKKKVKKVRNPEAELSCTEKPLHYFKAKMSQLKRSLVLQFMLAFGTGQDA
jgi:hypothetical protein